METLIHMKPTRQAHGTPRRTRTGGTRRGSALISGATGHRARPPVAPEVAARIVAWRAAGAQVADIAHNVGLTPGEVLDVLRSAERSAPMRDSAC